MAEQFDLVKSGHVIFGSCQFHTVKTMNVACLSGRLCAGFAVFLQGKA